MSKERMGLDSYIAAGMSKTASAPVASKHPTTQVGADLLAKLASEFGAANLADNESAASQQAATGEATGVPGASVGPQQLNAGQGSVASPAPAVAQTLQGIADPQVALAGGNPAEASVGSERGVGSVAPVRVSDMTGDIEEDLAIVNSVTNGEPVEKEKVASLLDACSAGRAMARAYVAETEKLATADSYLRAATFLKQAGIADGYQFAGVEMDKFASAEDFTALNKLANQKELSMMEVIAAADQYVAYCEKQASVDADAEKIASDVLEQARAEVAAEMAAQSQEKTASAPSEMSLESAIAVLKAAGRL